LQTNPEELEAMAHEPEAKPFGHLILQTFDLVIAKLYNFSRLDVDEMVVVGFGHFFIARPAVAEIVALQDVRPLVEFLDVGVIDGLGQDLSDDAPLVGHL
jgi:hypothetical protein